MSGHFLVAVLRPGRGISPDESPLRGLRVLAVRRNLSPRVGVELLRGLEAQHLGDRIWLFGGEPSQGWCPWLGPEPSEGETAVAAFDGLWGMSEAWADALLADVLSQLWLLDAAVGAMADEDTNE